MLFDQVPQQGPERLAFLVFRQDPGNVARDRIGSSGSHFPVDSGQLILRQTNRDFGPGHTVIIPLLNFVIVNQGRQWTPDPAFDDIIARQRQIDPDKWK